MNKRKTIISQFSYRNYEIIIFQPTIFDKIDLLFAILRDSIDQSKISRIVKRSYRSFIDDTRLLEEEGKTVCRRQWTRAIRRRTATYKDTSSRIRRRRIFLVSTGSSQDKTRCYELCKTCSFLPLFPPSLSTRCKEIGAGNGRRISMLRRFHVLPQASVMRLLFALLSSAS